MTINTNKILKSLFFGTVFMCMSCDDVLDEVPDNRTEIDSAEKIGELLTGAYPEGAYIPFLEPRTDNAEDKGRAGGDERINRESFFWNDVFDPDNDYPLNYWNSAYSAIAQANQALVSIEELRSSGMEDNLDKYEGEALLARSYAHFMLLNIWAKPYDSATAESDLGIPYVDEPETVLLKEYERVSVAEVYRNIVADLERGFDLIEDDYENESFHFTRAAAAAFASRVYLHLGQWEKVEQFSNFVLSSDNISNQLRDWVYYRSLTYSQISALYSSSDEPANLLVVSAGSLYARNFASARYQLAPGLSNELFSNGNPTGGAWAYPLYGTDLVYNIPKFSEYFRVTNASANIGNAYVQYVLLSTDEVLLNLAEAKVMLGKESEAMDYINLYLSKKTRSYNAAFVLSPQEFSDYYSNTNFEYKPFYNLNPEQIPFIHGLQELRRREFYEEGIRWFDIRRFNLVINHLDTENREIYTLESGDLRYSLQIPNEAVSFGLEPNPR